MAQWIQRQYGSGMWMQLPGNISIAVDWESAPRDSKAYGGYRVTAVGATLKERFSSVELAQAAGIKLARIRLKQALAALPPEETNKEEHKNGNG